MSRIFIILSLSMFIGVVNAQQYSCDMPEPDINSLQMQVSVY